VGWRDELRNQSWGIPNHLTPHRRDFRGDPFRGTFPGVVSECSWHEERVNGKLEELSLPSVEVGRRKQLLRRWLLRGSLDHVVSCRETKGQPSSANKKGEGSVRVPEIS
jgi:hypothetical protein